VLGLQRALSAWAHGAWCVCVCVWGGGAGQSGVLSLHTAHDGPVVGYLTTGSSLGAVALPSGAPAAVGAVVLTPHVHTLTLPADGLDDLVVLAANAKKLHLLQVKSNPTRATRKLVRELQANGRTHRPIK
jgi:hypothetical protein